MNLNEELGELFVEEARELLIEQEQTLLLLESSPADDDLVAKLFRGVHTLKGNSRILGFLSIERFAHQLENLLDLVRCHQLVVTKEITDALLLCQDVLQDLVQEVAGAGAHDVARYADALNRVTALQSIPNCDAAPALGPSPAVSPSRVMVALSLLPRELRDSLPDDVRASLPASEVAAVRPPPSAMTRSTHGDTDPSTESDEPAPPSNRAPQRSIGANPPISITPRVDAQKERPAPADTEAGSVRVPIEKLDRLINLTGEVVIAQSIIADLVSDLTPERIRALQEVVGQLDRHCRELQERMLGARMLPLRNVFGRFPRLVRDLAATTGKSVRLEISGEDTELDKAVIEKIADPLTHLVRNAIDHGVETGDARTAAGKPTQACLKLSAYQKGGNIFIDISDDGRGIDGEKVLAKAQASGLVRSGATPSIEEIHALIFRPGFSTADQVTELSGRGVGMDVVKRNVEALKGSISISSKPGAGTCFSIKLPLTLAIMDGLGVRVGSEVYLVPLLVVSESLQHRPRDVVRLPDAGEVIDVRGTYLPLLRLSRLFGVASMHEQTHDGILMVLDDGSQKVALLVDELLGQYQAVIKSLETNFRAVPGIAGATVLGDGRVALILDIGTLRALAAHSSQGRERGQDEVAHTSNRSPETAA